MPFVHILPFAVTLASGVLLSAIILLLSRPRTGQIRLPTHTATASNGHGHDSGEPEFLTEGLEEKQDLFDVSRPEDLVDGTPVDEDEFWQKTKLKKIALTALLALLVACEAVTLGFLAASTTSAQPLAASSLRLASAVYILVFSACSISDSGVNTHWAGLIHLSVLTAGGVLLLGISAILPDDDALAEVLAAAPDLGEAIAPLQYTVFMLYLAAVSLASTIPRGPPLHFPPAQIYSLKTLSTSAPTTKDNVCGIVQTSVAGFLLFSYTTPVVMLGYTSESLEIRDLPIVPADMRATSIYSTMRRAMRAVRLRRIPLFGAWKPSPGSGWDLMYRILRVNVTAFVIQIILASVSAVLYYAPALFLQRLIAYLEMDPGREDTRWGWVYALGLFLSNSINFLITGQLWGISTTTLQTRLRVQLNTTLFAKTLIRKDVASSSSSAPSEGATPAASDAGSAKDGKEKEKKDEEDDDFSSKAQVMTLMTVDVDRVSEFSWHFFSLIDAPVEIVIGSMFLYRLLGVSSLLGLAVSVLFLPLTHMASKVVVYAQDNLMKARDERVSLMNELLGAIRMVKFMAWERSSEKRVLTVRAKELKFQRLNYIIETAFTFIWLASPVLVTLVSFWHFAVIRQQILTPSIAFTSVSVFNELRFALSALPETFINMMQSLVSVRRIEKYLSSAEIQPSLSLHKEGNIVLNSATITWPQDRGMRTSATPSVAATPRGKFVLLDLTLSFPDGELSLICGKLGSGKTLLLLGLLGEADLLAGQVICPRTPADTLALASGLPSIPDDEWIVQGVVAYVPQSAWLQNASIRDNILFNLPYNEVRYQKTLQVCALEADLEILEDGDMAEIGERGVNLSGGQKARISLARAVYSRAATVLLDDVLSAVDAHTAHHLFDQCLKGELLTGRTVILVSHHVQLCLPGASYVISLDNGHLQFTGKPDDFRVSGIMEGLEKEKLTAEELKKAEELAKVETIEQVAEEVVKEEKEGETGATSESTTSTAVPNSPSSDVKKVIKKVPRKVVEEERRAVGRIGTKVWLLYVHACGNWLYWSLFILALLSGAAMPVAENLWLRFWSANGMTGGSATHSPVYYLGVYGLLSVTTLMITSARLLVLYEGSIHASTVLYKRLLEAVLFAKIRFHDTVSRGRLLNRFGKDFEGLDSSLADNFGRTLFYALNVVTTFVTVSYIGGPGFMVAACFLGFLYYQVAKVYGQTARDMRRLDSVTKSPLYTIYGDAISGVGVLRAFGASTKILREMLQLVDTNTNPYYWMWSVNRWLSARFNLLSAAVVGVTALIVILNPRIDASFAGFALAFSSNVMNDLLFMVRRFVGLEQSMVALERVNEFSEVDQEAPEFIEPRPPAGWPERGNVEVENLVIRYAPELPNVLHGLTFSVKPKQKIGILGRTGCGKSTLALSFFRFVEPTEGRILIDDIDITTIGLTDLRSRITIIPQDPTIFSGSLRSTLDVFNEYDDAEIFEALRRVHLLPPVDDEPSTSQAAEAAEEEVNTNVFKSLDSPVSEGGENFSAGEKQLICMARAILRRSKVLLMDEATASVDYETDELIGKTIRHEFADSTILTIAHRLRTVIDYDKVLVLDQGRIAEYDEPATLLANTSSMFYSLCKSTGKNEFEVLKKTADDAAAARTSAP